VTAEADFSIGDPQCEASVDALRASTELLTRLRDEGRCELRDDRGPAHVSHWRRKRAIKLNTKYREHSRPIRSTGLWRDTEDINQTPRRRFTRLSIRAFWADCLWRKPLRKFDSPWECLEADYCFACGMLWGVPTDRSHIVSRVWGGQDELSNLHLLCPICHDQSECLQGMSYWRWLKRQHVFKAASRGAAKMLHLHHIDASDLTASIDAVHDLAKAFIRHVRPQHFGR
jgi:hypothetical protein